MRDERNQEQWPFGPTPTRKCWNGLSHWWKLIDLYHAAEPPAPSFQCEYCYHKWTRGWTAIEFAQWLEKADEATRAYYSVCEYPDEPPYAEDWEPSHREIL